MKHHRRRALIVTSALALALGLSVLGGVALAGNPFSGASPANVLPPDNPSLRACQEQGGTLCNPDPSVHATFVARNPEAQAPAANPTYITQQAAESEARAAAASPLTGAAPPSAIADARLLPRTAMNQQYPELRGNLMPDPRRYVWVVTVHAPTSTPGDISSPPRLFQGYTLVIDAVTGTITDQCYSLACENLVK